jgi:AraC-like DNA-binding protein
MPSGESDFAPLRFSTNALPVRDRVPFWREVFARQILRVEIEPLSDAPFEADATLRALPGLRTLSYIGAAARYRRTPLTVSDGDDALTVLMNVAGAMTAAQRAREASLGPGDAALLLHTETAAMTHSQIHYSPIHYQALIVPRAALASLVGDVEDAAMRVIPHHNEALRLLAGYWKTVGKDLVLAMPELRHLVVTHVHDLVAMSIGATLDGAAIAADRGVRAARLAVIKADIIERLGRRDLTLVAVAARQHVTPRYVQKLFEREGVTFSEFVLDQRLTGAYRMLADGRHGQWTVSAVAFASGFGDLSYFNRVFRRRYGATPSDVRADAQRISALGRGHPRCLPASAIDFGKLRTW